MQRYLVTNFLGPGYRRREFLIDRGWDKRLERNCGSRLYGSCSFRCGDPAFLLGGSRFLGTGLVLWGSRINRCRRIRDLISGFARYRLRIRRLRMGGILRLNLPLCRG